jgi:hypothetical protein
VIVGGQLDGNIDAAARVELLQTGVLNGELKAAPSPWRRAHACAARRNSAGTRSPSTDERMNGRVAVPGKTRICPHCKTTILESSSVCPSCQHHLRFDRESVADRRAQPRSSALRVEGTFRNPEGANPGNTRW